MDEDEIKQKLQSIKTGIERFGRINQSDHQTIVACLDYTIKNIEDLKKIEEQEDKNN